MIESTGQAILGILLLLAGGSGLVRGAATLARRLGVSKLVVGLTIVAFGTSAPELVVSLDAAVAGLGGIALGNVIGSNIGNICLILGLAAVVRPVAAPRSVTRFDGGLVLGVSLLLVVLLRDDALSRFEGGLLVVGLLLSLAVTYRRGRASAARETGDRDASDVLEVVAMSSGGLRSAAGVVFGIVALYFGGRFLVAASVDLAAALGLAPATIGLTVVAVGTSLPELATSVVAARQGESDLAIGNVLGSNLFNILGILGISALASPMQIGALRMADLGVMVAAAALLLPALHTDGRLSRREGAAFLLGYVAYVAWLIVR